MKSTRDGALVAVEGYPFIAIGGALTVLALFLGWGVATVLFLLLTIWVVWFFRNPHRIIPVGEGLVVAPADGRVLGVEKVENPADGTDCMRVAIFMNVFNVHVNRLPVAGTVTDVTYTPGRFFNASFDKASVHNERNRVTVETADGHKVTFIQIAGLVARRIVCWAKPGDGGNMGDIFGLIRFGSRVDVHLPLGTEIVVESGQRVSAGATVLGRLP